MNKNFKNRKAMSVKSEN